MQWFVRIADAPQMGTGAARRHRQTMRMTRIGACLILSTE